MSLGAGGAAFPPTRDAAVSVYEGLRQAVLARPEFRIRRIEVTGAGHTTDKEIVDALDLNEERRAALGFNAREARRRIEELGWVARASVTLRPPYTLQIDIDERRPGFLWRIGGELQLLDRDGRRIVDLRDRKSAPALPLIVGDGADAAAREARDLYKLAVEAKLPIIGLTRIGGRRWDLEMLSGPRLMLPEEKPVEALERAIRWVGEAGLLDRGFAIVDLRIPHAPTARRGAATTQRPARNTARATPPRDRDARG